MRDDIERWMNSDKYKLFQQMIKEKREKAREELLELKYKLMRKDEILMTKDELEEFIDNVLESAAEAEGDTEWLQMVLAQDLSRDDMFVHYIKTVHTWYVYLFVYEQKEDFELCHKIMQVISAETHDLKKMIEIKFNLTPLDESYIEEILEEYRIQND